MTLFSKVIGWVSFKIRNFAFDIARSGQKYFVSKFPKIDKTAVIGFSVRLIGPYNSIEIGKHTYINDAIISAGENSKVTIGSHCAIGYRVSIKAVSHDLTNPYPDENGKVQIVEKNISIGNRCWIGDNVFIREGITIGNHVVIGSNSVVTKSVPDNIVVAGVPARSIRTSNSETEK
ncbi:acyltransferase [bacterium]|nr:acyltransferase [bacterium]